MNNTTTREGIAAEVRAAMARKKMTQGQLAEQVGISRVALSERLNAHRPFDVEVLYRISNVLEVAFIDLIPEDAA